MHATATPAPSRTAALRVRIFLLLALLAYAVAPTALAAQRAQAAPAAQTGPLPVLVSITPQKYIVERIGGNAVSVTVLAQPGADPHSYEPSPSQLREASSAALWLTIGVPFEDAWTSRITGAAEKLETVSFLTGIQRLPAQEGTNEPDKYAQGEAFHGGHGNDGHEHGEDPHVWLSPMLVREMLPGIARELGKRLPDKAAEFRKNARAFADELEALDNELAALFAPVPQERRVFLTFHPSWRYFAYNYQLTELSIEVDGKQPGPRTLERVAATAKEHGITTVFVEPQFSRSSAQAVADVIGARIEVLDPLAEDLPALYRGVAQKLVDSFKTSEE